MANDVTKNIFIKKNILEVSSASPKTRKFARELGVDIDQILGSARQGRVVTVRAQRRTICFALC